MEIELIELMVIQLVWGTFFARFEIEVSAIIRITKWLIVDGITIGLFFLVGHWATIFPLIALIQGTIFHLIWCKKNGIDPLKATPRKKYYQLRKWKWEE